jgi:aminoglycoside phosphotransferase
MEEKGEKITCECGSVVLKKNLASHVKTKKHQSVANPPSLHRGVSFADAQHTDRADVDDEDDDDDDESGDEEEEAFEELFDMIEELGKVIVVLDKKLDNLFDRVEETRLKTNSIIGEVRDISLRLPYPQFEPNGRGPEKQQ